VKLKTPFQKVLRSFHSMAVPLPEKAVIQQIVNGVTSGVKKLCAKDNDR